MKKPDRFEREVAKLPRQYSSDDAEGLCPLVDVDDVTQLLRRQHRAMVRMVRAHRKSILAMQTELNPIFVDGQDDCALGIINAFNNYKR